MRTVWRRTNLGAVAVALAISAFGFGVRFLLVHVPSGIDVPPMCELSSDFWRGDEVLC